MAENFPNLMKNMNIHLQETQQTLIKKDMKKPHQDTSHSNQGARLNGSISDSHTWTSNESETEFFKYADIPFTSTFLNGLMKGMHSESSSGT